MRGALGELRIASRILGRSPGTSVLAVAALALGIGLTTVMFSILGDVITLVLRQGGVQVGLGLLLGLGLAAVLSRGLTMLFFQVEPWDPAIFLGVAGVLTATGFLACFLPARKATRVDPLVALRPD